MPCLCPRSMAISKKRTGPRQVQARTSDPEFFDALPVDFEPEPRRLRQAHHAIANLGPAPENRVVQWVAACIAMRFSAERGVTERRDQMPVQMSHRMRCDQHAFLFRIMRDPQRFRKPRMPRRIELNIPYRAGVDEIADSITVPLPLTVRQRNGRRRGQALEIGWLQIPMQRLLQQEYIE